MRTTTTLHERILQVGDLARSGVRLNPADWAFVRDEVPEALAAFPRIEYPERIRHPAGFLLSGAVVRTHLKAAMVLGARRALGVRYDARSEFYDRVMRDLTLWLALSHFRHGDPRGAYCCAQCTLAIYPVLRAGALRLVDCKQLHAEVRALIVERRWRFSTATQPKMIAWALQ